MTESNASRSQFLQVADRSHARVINQQAILNHVYQTPGISKAQLAKELGISKPAISSNVEDLMEMGLLLERGEGEASASGGRKPTPLFFNATCCVVGAVDLSFQEPVCAVADLENNIIGLEKLQTSHIQTAQERKACIRDAFLHILETHGVPREKLATIVISQPGIIQNDENEHFSAEQHHAWTEIGLHDYLEETLSATVLVRNDVNLAALGELYYGCDRTLEDLIYVSCGVGLGAAIIIQNKLYTGQKNAAGEIGACMMMDGTTLEDYVAIKGLIARTQARLAQAGKNGALTFEDIVQMVNAGDTIACETVWETGRVLGRAMYNLCATLDIPTVIFGGEYLALGDTLWHGIREALEAPDRVRPEAIPSDLRYTAGLYGCFVTGKERAIANILQMH